jgi:hypothetical protein
MVAAKIAPPGLSDSKEFKITLHTNIIKTPPLAEVSLLLYYFNRLYEVARLATDYKYYDQRERKQILDLPLPGFKKYKTEEELEQEKQELERKKQIAYKQKLEKQRNKVITLNSEDILRVQKLTITSPLELILLLNAVPVAVASIWGLMQALEKVVNIKKTLLEIKKLERENSKKEDINEVDSSSDEEQLIRQYIYDKEFFNRRLEYAGMTEEYERVKIQLLSTTIKIIKMDIEVVDKTQENKEEG